MNRNASFLTLALSALTLLALPATAGPEPLLNAARRSAERGDPLAAQAIYLELAGKLGDLSTPDQRAVIEGLLAVNRALTGTRQFEPAVHGALVLLRLTHPNPLGVAFSLKVRLEIDRLAFDLVLLHRSDLAVSLLRELMADGPGPPMRWALLARAYVENGEPERASDTLQRGLQLHPASPELLFVRAALAGSLAETAVGRAAYAAAESMLQQALTDLEAAAEHESGAPGIWRSLGKVRGALWFYTRATGQYDRAQALQAGAEEAYEFALALDRRNPDIAFELAELLFAAEDWHWAGQTYAEALRRYSNLLQASDLSAALHATIREQIERCDLRISLCLYQRAVSAAMTGAFERALELALQAGARRPAFAPQSRRLVAAIVRNRESLGRRVAELERADGEPQHWLELGDLWLGLGNWERAESAYRRAQAADTDPGLAPRIASRLFGVQALPTTSQLERLTIGSLEAELELPAGMDAAELRALLEKAHALTMATFPHRLLGPLRLRVFANRRQFLERANPGVGERQEGMYALGQLATFVEPSRSRRVWLDILVHEMAHRYIDELSYARAPRWLSEGLAQWTSRGWRRVDQRRFHRLAAEGRLVAWGALDERFAESWVEPHSLDGLYLQSHQIVAWLVGRFGLDAMVTLLARLRQGSEPPRAFQDAFGMGFERLQTQWLREAR